MPKNHKINRSRKPSPDVAVLNNQYFKRCPPQGTNGHCPVSESGSHWWVINEPCGMTSEGVCKFCGKTKQFFNSVDASLSKRIRGGAGE
jgi:hypothetical protein